MQPRPIAETAMPEEPSVRFGMLPFPVIFACFPPVLGAMRWTVRVF